METTRALGVGYTAAMQPAETARLNRRWNCRLTTVGRNSGLPRMVTLWFVLEDGTVYFAGGKQRPQWCRNIRANGVASVEIAGTTMRGRARVVESPAEGQPVIDRVLQKYLLARLSRPFGGYKNAVPVVIELETG